MNSTDLTPLNSNSLPDGETASGAVPAADVAAESEVAQHDAERATYRRASRLLAIFLGALTVLSLIVGWFVAGTAGLWAALIGIGLAGLFCGGTMWSITHTIGAAPVSMAATIMLTWLAKLIILIAVLAFLRGRDFFHPQLLFAVIAVGVIGSLIWQALVLKRGRAPYVVPNTRTF